MTSFIIGGAVILTVVLVGVAFSCRLIRREYAVYSRKIKKPFTAVHISDLHESVFGKLQDKLIRTIEAENPDVILITGDMVEDGRIFVPGAPIMDSANSARIFFERAVKIAPAYMVLGNHESNIPDTVKLVAEIAATGVHLLHRNHAGEDDVCFPIKINGEAILLASADDPYFDRAHPHKNTFSERMEEDRNRQTPNIVNWRERLKREYADIKDDKRLTLLLSHRPEEFDVYRELGFDVAFSGHAHGGQFRLPPFINGFYAPHQGFFPKHAGGCYKYDGFTHIVSRGLSKRRMVRIFNRPEICVVKFMPR